MPRPALVTPFLWTSLGLSLACGFVAQVLLAHDPQAFTQHWFRQATVLVALHLTTLGFVGILILGVLTQFLPMLLGRSLGSTALAGAALAAFVLGFLVLIGLFAAWRAPLPAAAAGLALVSGSAATLALAWPALVHFGPNQRLCRATLASSLFYLVLTAGLGGLMAQGLVGPPWLAPGPLDVLKLHAHLGLVGFACLMVFAVSYELLPMFNLAKGYAQWPGWVTLALVHAGLAAIAVSVFSLTPAPGPWCMAGEGLLALACLFYALQVLWIQSRARRLQQDASVWLFRQACLALVAAAVTGFVLATQDAPGPGAVAAAVYLLLFGFLGGAIVSQIQKIVPLMAWVDRFSALAGKAQVPIAGHLLNKPLAWLALPLHFLALVSGCAGLATGSIQLLRISGCFGAALFVDQALLAASCRLRGQARPFPMPDPFVRADLRSS